jgi:hypothetical protein
MLKHLFPLFEHRSEATSGQSVLGWVTALWVCDADQLLASGVVSRREAMIHTCGYTLRVPLASQVLAKLKT